MGLAKGKARSIIENSEGVVDAISEIVRTGEKYPILVNEGIVALTLLSTTDSGGEPSAPMIAFMHIRLHNTMTLSPFRSQVLDRYSLHGREPDPI